MRCFAPFLLLLALCFAAAAAPPKVAEADVDFLLTSAASDFRTHQPGTLRFRNVRLGRIPLSEGEIQPLLCGQFQTSKPEWIPFATIKTSGYEQWIGGQGQSFCENASVVWVEDRDLTAALQNKFDALR